MKYSLTTDFEDDDFHLAHAGPLVLMNWRGNYHRSSFRKIEELHLRLAERRREHLTGISIVEAHSPIPGEEIRIAGANMMTHTGATTKAVVIIFLDQGFMASALQSVAARELSLGGRVPMKFFHDLPNAAQWLAQAHPQLEMTPLDMEQLLKKLRVKFSPSRLPAPQSSSGRSSSIPPDRLSGVVNTHASSLPPSERGEPQPLSSQRSPQSAVRGRGLPPKGLSSNKSLSVPPLAEKGKRRR